MYVQISLLYERNKAKTEAEGCQEATRSRKRSSRSKNKPRPATSTRRWGPRRLSQIRWESPPSKVESIQRVKNVIDLLLLLFKVGIYVIMSNT